MQSFVNFFFSQIDIICVLKNRNIFDLWKCASMDFLKLAFLNFFIPFRRDEAITWDNFVTAKQDPGIPKEGSCLPGMKLFTSCSNHLSLL